MYKRQDQVSTDGLAKTDLLTGITLTPSTAEVTNDGKITPSAAVIMRGTDIATGNYQISYATGVLTITPAKPSYTVPTGLTAVYGQTLADVKLPVVPLPGVAGGDTPGRWSWDAPDTSVGTAGEHTFGATFTPADQTNYQTAAGIDVTLTVEQADPQIGDCLLYTSLCYGAPGKCRPVRGCGHHPGKRQLHGRRERAADLNHQ